MHSRPSRPEGNPQFPAPLNNDPRLTPAVAARYGKWRGLIEVHQRELNFAERRRRRAIELLFTMQDRRRRNATEEAVVVTDPARSERSGERQDPRAAVSPGGGCGGGAPGRILGRPVSGARLAGLDPQTLAALRLADSEARLDRALEHHAAQFATKRDPEADRLSESVADLLHFDWVEDRDRREAARRVMG